MAFVRAKRRGGQMYYYLVEGVREGGKVRQRVVKYLGKAADLATPPAAPGLPITSVESSVHYGSAAALHALAQELGLAKAVDAVVPKGGGPRLGKLFEVMVINRCLDPVSRHRLPEWYETTALPRLVGIPTNRVSDDVFYNALSYFTDDRVTRIQQALWKTLEGQGADTTRLFYDLTSTYFEGRCVAMARYGYSRDHRPDRLQINLAVAVNPQGYPITHTVLEGNVADVSTLQDASQRIQSQFRVPATWVVDRGLMSADNRKDLVAKRIDYIAGVPLADAAQRFLTSLPDDAYVQADPEDSRYWVQEGVFDSHRVIAVWNKDKAADDLAWRSNALNEAEASLAKLHARIGTRDLTTKRQVLARAHAILERHRVQKLITLHINRQGPPSLTWSRDAHASAFEAQWDGKWLIETNTQLPAANVFWAYHERDTVEKFMQAIKGVVDLRPVYVHDETHVKAHVFVCVTSVLLLQVLRQRLITAKIDLSAVRALRRLDAVMEVVVKQGDELRRMLTRRSADQQQLLNVAGVAAI